MTDTTRQRRNILVDGKRVSVDLEPTEWRVVEQAAALAGEKTTKWAGRQLSAAKLAGAKNMVAYLRAAAMEALLAELSHLTGRAELEPVMGFEQANTPNDDQFQEMIEAAQINGTVDLIGCTVMAGVNESGNVAFYIRNGWRDGLHMTISTPMTPEEWQERMGPDAF